jgi:SagB-type dehydrogenase family enzyme
MTRIDLSKFFHLSSKDNSKGHPPISKNPSEWPSEWKVQEYKTYPRFQKIVLPEERRNADFFDLISKRKSQRDFKKEPISIQDISTILKYSCGITRTDKGKSKRAQPSGGGRFPLEVYVVVFVPTDNLPSGLYHYDVKNHQLSILWQKKFDETTLQKLFTYDWATQTSVGILITGVFERNQIKYGERGYRYVLIESGHVGQNIYLNCEALGLKCCSLGGTHDYAIEQLLDIDGVSESLIYSVVIGK